MTIAESNHSETVDIYGFLRAEDAATELVEQLQRLRDETEHYASSRAALDEVSRGLGGSAGMLASLGDRMGDVIETLRSIGTAELLNGQEHLAGSVDALASTVGNLSHNVDGQLIDVSKALDTVRTELARLRDQQAWQQQELGGKLAHLPTIESITQLEKDIKGKFAEQVHVNERLEASVAASAAAIASLRRVVITCSLILLVAFGASTSVAFLVHH